MWDMSVVIAAILEQPLFFAAVVAPLVVRVLCLLKFTAPTSPFYSTPPSSPSGARTTTATTATRSTKTAKGETEKTAKKRSYFKFFIRALYWCFFLLCFTFGAVVVYVIAEWKGAAVICPSLFILFLTVRWTTRPSFMLDCLITITLICVLSLLSSVSTATMGQNVIVSQDPAHFHACRTVQDGVDSVKEGGSVRIFPGTYTEAVVVSKNIVLMGMGEHPGDVILRAPPPSTGSAVATEGSCEDTSQYYDGAALKVVSDSYVSNIQIVADSSEALVTPKKARTIEVGEKEEKLNDGEIQATPGFAKCKPVVYLGDTFLGTVLQDVEVVCNGVCLLSLVAHPFMQHALHNVTIRGELNGTAFDTTLSTHLQGIDVNGESEYNCAHSKEVQSALQSLHHYTERHTATTILILKWVDASAHWAVELYGFVNEYVLPELVKYWRVVRDALSVVLNVVMTFACGATNAEGWCPAEKNEQVYNMGVALYSLFGFLLVALWEYCVQFANLVVEVLFIAFEGVFVPFLGWVMRTVPAVMWFCVSGTLASSQMVQVGIHVVWLVGTIVVAFSGDIPALFSSSFLMAMLQISKNLPMLIPIAVCVLWGVALEWLVCVCVFDN